MNKLSIAKEFFQFLTVRKKWLLVPIIVFMLLLGACIVFTESSALAPLIYAIF